jgi:hypothetical protein
MAVLTNDRSPDSSREGDFLLRISGEVCFGNCGVGIFEGPNLDKVISGVAKTPLLNKHYMLRFEAAFAKVFNPANYAPPQTNISYANFGA